MNATPAKSPLATWKKWVIYTIALGASAILIWTQLPQGPYPTDLDRIGAGKPAAVLIYDVNTAGGMMTMEHLNPLRTQYSDQMEFLVASQGLPDGREFASRYRVSSGAVVFFTADGTHSSSMRAPQSVEDLHRPLKRAISQSTP